MSSSKLAILLFISLTWISCSSSKQAQSFSPPANFNAEEYYSSENFDNTPGNFMFTKASVTGPRFEIVYKEKNKPNIKKSGKAVAKIYINEHGIIDNITMLEATDNDIAQVAKNQVLNLAFKPAQLNGEAVKSILKLTLRIDSNSTY